MYLEASAAAGNFTRAAKSLGINTSTISRRVGRFEDELGLALFERGHGGVRLTSGGKAVLPHIRRALAELDAIRHAGDQNGNGIVGEVRLAVRMPPIGEPLCEPVARVAGKASGGRADDRGNERVGDPDSRTGAPHRCCSDDEPHAVARRRDGAALPRADGCGDPVVNIRSRSKRRSIGRACGRKPSSFRAGTTVSPPASSTLRSWAAASGSSAHAASKQCVFALVAAGFGITLATTSQAEVVFPGVVYRPIREENAWVQVELVWCPEAEDPAVGRFVAFMRDEARSRRLF